MKYCNKCGTQVSDDKRFCPNCRAYLPEKPNRMPDEAPVEKPVETPAEKPVEKPKQIARVWFRCPKCGAEFERVSYNGEPPVFGVCNACGYYEGAPLDVPPETVDTHVDEPHRDPMDEPPPAEPARRKAAKVRDGVRWWHIALPVLLAVLALAGLYAYRSLQHPVEDAWYDAGKALKSVNYFDKDGHLTGCEGYADGEIAYTKEYRTSVTADQLDPSEVEQVEGVVTTECLQVYQRDEGHAGFMPENTYKIFGYDKRGNLIVENQYYWPEGGKPILSYTTRYERDASGRIEKTTITAGNGDAFLEHTYDSKRVFGLCTQADVTETQYGTLEYADGVFYVDPYTPTREVQYVVKYRH